MINQGKSHTVETKYNEWTQWGMIWYKRHGVGRTWQFPSCAQLLCLQGWTEQNCSLQLLEFMPETIGPYLHNLSSPCEKYLCTFVWSNCKLICKTTEPRQGGFTVYTPSRP